MPQSFKISLLIPTMNRPEELERNLKSVFSSTVKPDEIIVSDDSNDGIAPKTKMVIKKFPEVKYIKGPRRGISANENNLIRNASGNLLVKLDDDTIVDRYYFKNMIECYKKYSKIYGENIIITGKEIRNGEEVIPGEITFLGYQAKHPKDYTNVKAIVACSTLFPRKLFEKVRYDEFLYFGSDEIDVAYQALFLGYRIIFCSEVINIHNQSQINRTLYEAYIEKNRIYETLKIYGIYERHLIKFLLFSIVSPIHLIMYWIKNRKISKKKIFSIIEAFKMFNLFYKQWKKI